MESPGREPVKIDLSTPGSETTLKDKPFKIKEGSKFTMVAAFKVQHEILSGLHYVQVVKRKGIRVSKDSEMIVGCHPLENMGSTLTRQTGKLRSQYGSTAPLHQEM
jgi:Rho GDP-dissociation inhibitor